MRPVSGWSVAFAAAACLALPSAAHAAGPTCTPTAEPLGMRTNAWPLHFRPSCEDAFSVVVDGAPQHGTVEPDLLFDPTELRYEPEADTTAWTRSRSTASTRTAPARRSRSRSTSTRRTTPRPSAGRCRCGSSPAGRAACTTRARTRSSTGRPARSRESRSTGPRRSSGACELHREQRLRGTRRLRGSRR